MNNLLNSDKDGINKNNNHEFNTCTQINHQLFSNEEINIHIRSLNKKEKMIFDIVIDWGRKFV